MSAAKCLRFKEPEVDDYLVYKYTESETTEDELSIKPQNEPEKEKEDDVEEDTEVEENLLISEKKSDIKSSIELLNHDYNDSKPIENVNNNNNSINNLNNVTNKSMESMGSSFVIYKEGDGSIIEGIPQIEIKLNISRDNLLASQAANNNYNNSNSNIYKNMIMNKINNININGSNNSLNNLNNNVKNSNSSLNSKRSNSEQVQKLLSLGSKEKLNSRNNSQEKLNENIKLNTLDKKNNRNNNNSLLSLNSKQSSNISLNIVPGPEKNTKSIADRSMERTLKSQKKMHERKLLREKLRSQMNEKKNRKSREEISINISNIEENENNEENNNDSGKIKLVSRDKPLNKNSSTNVSNTDEKSDTLVNSNPYTPRNKANDSEIIPKKDEDINKILKEVSETHFLIDDTGINLENILKILGQKEITTIDETIGEENLESATHMKNFEHGALFKISSQGNCILKIIPFDTERNDLDLDYNIDNNQVSLKTVYQEVIAMNVLPSLHISGEISNVANITGEKSDEENKNQVSLEIEDEEITNEKKILTFTKPKGIWICKGTTNQAFKYEFQNYQLNEFSKDQYYLVILFDNKGEIVNSTSNKNRSLDQIKSILWQICYSLSLAEDSLGFEHRELYPECILVEEVPREELKYKVNDNEIIKDNFGVKATILDYSRSRLEYGGKVYYSDLTSVVYDDPSKSKSLQDIKTVLDSTWYQTASIVNRASFADLIQSFSWIVECDKAMTNWLYNNMLEFAVRVEYNINSMKDALNDPFWELSKENWETYEMNKATTEYSPNDDCIIL